MVNADTQNSQGFYNEFEYTEMVVFYYEYQNRNYINQKVNKKNN